MFLHVLFILYLLSRSVRQYLNAALSQKKTYNYGKVYRRGMPLHFYLRFFIKELEAAVTFYNGQQNSSNNYLSPSDVLQKKFPLEYPWEKIDKCQQFDYIKNKKEIDTKIQYVKSKLPLLTPVRISVQKSMFKKYYNAPPWSKQVYFVFRIKRPILHIEPILVKVCDKLGKIYHGVFQHDQLKKVPLNFQQMPIVYNISHFINRDLYVNIEGFPKRLLFKVPFKRIRDFKLSENALKQLKKIQHKL